jgi:uncharacterized delta-60 repeat protein
MKRSSRRTLAAVGVPIISLLIAAAVAPPAAAARVRGAQGQLDPSFGTNGTVVTGFPGLAVGASALAAQGPNSFVVAGGEISENSPSFLLARYRGDGTLDTRFGDAGRVVTPLPAATGASGAEAVAIQPDRRIVVVGTAGLGSGSEIGFAVVRYLADGRLDQSFGGTGIVVTPVGPVGDAGGTGVAVQRDGKIVAVRYLPNGTLDPAFGDGGSALVLIPGGDAAANAVTVQPDGKIVLVGTAIGPGLVGQQFALVRLTSDGKPDPSFGGDGIVVAQNQPSQGKGGAEDAVIEPDGSILVAGLAETAAGQGAFGLMRFLSDGTLDPAFGGGSGMVLTQFTGESVATTVLVRRDGRIVAVGSAGFPSTVALAGYLHDGTLDPAFGTCGQTTTAIGEDSSATGALLVRGGRILVAGTTFNAAETEGSFALARYLGSYSSADGHSRGRGSAASVAPCA